MLAVNFPRTDQKGGGEVAEGGGQWWELGTARWHARGWNALATRARAPEGSAARVFASIRAGCLDRATRWAVKRGIGFSVLGGCDQGTGA
jgi:hypothetical protein